MTRAREKNNGLAADSGGTPSNSDGGLVDSDALPSFGSLPSEWRPAYDRLRDILQAHGPMIIAYSGGVDSGLLTCVAHAVLGEGALPVIAISGSLGEREEEAATEFLEQRQIRYGRLHTAEMDNAHYRRNAPDRCYHCKSELFSGLHDLARRRGYSCIAYGANLDDAAEYRPGAVAAGEQRVVAPLAEAGLTKAAIRSIARALGLSLWDKPAAPCLASRIPYFSEVTPEKLAQIERAENVLKELGFPVCRVRHHGQEARIEVPRDDHAALRNLWTRVVAGIEAAGFRCAVIEPDGFRSGRLNDVLGRTPVRRPGA